MSKRKMVRPGVREISPVSIYGVVYGGKDLRKKCVLWIFVLWCMIIYLALFCGISVCFHYSSL